MISVAQHPRLGESGLASFVLNTGLFDELHDSEDFIP